jgi:GNAT superfamily N-acetyltransferase
MYNDYLLDENSNKFDTLWLSDVFVYPEYRSKGVAKTLINMAKSNGLYIESKLYLCCETHLIKFYENQGFELIKPKTHLSSFWNIMVLNKISN